MTPSRDNSNTGPSWTEATAQPADQNKHENVTEQVQRQAQKLVDRAGSPGLARRAIEVIEQQQGTSEFKGTVKPITSKDLSDSGFLESLKNFETALETPVVPGELLDWAEAAKRACEDLGDILCKDLQDKHAELFARILKEDNEMGTRVENLRATDTELCHDDFNDVRQGLTSLLDRVSAADPKESELNGRVEKIVEKALAFVIKARTQETAIATWFMEAFNRDRGAGD